MIKKISFILPAYNEGENIKSFINEITELKLDNVEIIVIDNKSTDNTKNEVMTTSAKYYYEEKQGYGYALKKGLELSTGEYLVTCEPDGTFDAQDIYKFLPYIKNFDAVFGTRTSKAMILRGAKMNSFLRLGNIFVAKFLSTLFNGPSITDVGCTFKIIKRASYEKIRDSLLVNNSTFQPEFMIAIFMKNISSIEIPVFYKQRIGYSKITYSFISSFKLGISMILLIIKRRFF